MRLIFRMAILALAVASLPARAQSDDLDTQIVLNTFRVQNPKSSATVFVLVRPAPGDERKSQFILVTAAHVFVNMQGDEATLDLRKTSGKDGDEWTKVPVKIKVRRDGKTLWTQHPSSDVAVMPFEPPADAPVRGLAMELLATDDKLKQYEIHPGDALRHAGYPHPNVFEASAAGFPVVRTGCIAGFPLTPSLKTKSFLCDFNTFEGNSGGPIYLADNNRFFNGKMQSERVQLILGLMSLQHFIDDKFETPYESGKFKHRLGLGVAVNAGIIRETIEMLPKTTSASPRDEKKKEN